MIKLSTGVLICVCVRIYIYILRKVENFVQQVKGTAMDTLEFLSLSLKKKRKEKRKKKKKKKKGKTPPPPEPFLVLYALRGE